MDWNGLAAECRDLMGGDEPGRDYPYYAPILQRNGGSTLEIGCGTGRLLLRYLRDGFHVEGIDTAADSLAICRRKAEQQGLAPALYQQAMQSLELPRRYRTILVPCGTFHLVADRRQAREALRRFYDHLEAGGTLVLALMEPTWEDLTNEGVSQRPSTWWAMGEATRPSDGARLVAHWMKESIDRVEQVLTNRYRYQVWSGDRLDQEEHHTMRLRWYYQHELRLMLEQAGFHDVQVTGDYTHAPLDATHETWVFSALR